MSGDIANKPDHHGRPDAIIWGSKHMSYSVRSSADDRISELEEENAHLKRQLGLLADTAMVTKVMRRWRLTGKEAQLLVALHDAKGRACSKDHLLDVLYGQGEGPEIKIIDVFVCKVRAKIGADKITTVWGRGYMLSTVGQTALDAVAGMDAWEVPLAPRPDNSAAIILKALVSGDKTSEVISRGSGLTTMMVSGRLNTLTRLGLSSGPSRRFGGVWSITEAGRAWVAALAEEAERLQAPQ
jgi:hypothetical protein